MTVETDPGDFAAYLAETDPAMVLNEAEQSVLGAQLLFPDVLGQDWLPRPADYGEADHREIASAIAACAAAGAVDPITVFDYLQAAGKAQECGGLTYLNGIAQSVPSRGAIKSHAAIVRRKAYERGAAGARAQAAALLKGPSDTASVLSEVRAILDGIEAPASHQHAFRLMGASDLGRMPPLTWCLKPVLPRVKLAAVFGPSGSAKTFILLGMAAAAAEGGEWFGYPSKGGQRWVYVALEGQAGIHSRVRAWESFNGRAYPDDVRFVFEPFKLTDPDDVLALAAVIDASGGADVIVIDTLNRAAPGADENSSVDMGAILEGGAALHDKTGALILFCHHSGKNVLAGMRGHSSLFAALDAVIEVSRTDDRRELKIAKVKDGEDGAVHPFRLQAVDLGEDEDGEPVTSCVVVPDGQESASAPRAKLPRGGNQKIMLDALAPLFRESHTFGRAGAPAVRPCLLIEEAVEKAAARLTVEPKRRKERALQAITGLVASGVLTSNEGWIWLT